MAPSQLLIKSSDEAQNSSYCAKSSVGSGRSKAQLCLQKILRTILTIPPEPIIPDQPSSISSPNDTRNKDKSFIPDINIRNLAVPAPHTEESPALVVGDEVISFHDDDENESKGEKTINQGEDCMGLLIEAAKMIFGEFRTEEKHQILEDLDESTANTKPEIKRKQQRWTAVDLYEDMEPVVRSKRGRTQVLPCKFRDSVLEPLTRISRNPSTIIATKRRLR